MDDLSLQVRLIDPVIITDNQVSNAGCCQIHGNRGAQSTHANNQNPRIQQLLLPGFSHLWELDLPAVSFDLVR